MTISTYSTNMTDLYAGAGSTANWAALGGGAGGLNAETDYFIQGTGMTSKNAFASARKGMIFDASSDRASLVGTDGAFLMWTTHAAPGAMDTMANGGLTMLVGSGTGDYKHWYVGGSDTLEFLGWILAAVNPSETTDEADAGTPTAVEQFIGALFDLPAGGPTKGAPNAIDAIRVGRCDLIYEFGTGADPEATFDLAVADKGDVADRLGLIQERAGAFFCSGLHQFGSATNAVEFTDSAKTLFWNDHPAVTAPFNTVDIQNASSVISFTNISWKALGTKSPGTWITTDNATVNLITSVFTDWGSFTFDTNTTVDRCSFISCDQIIPGGADLTGSSVSGYEGAADTSALVWNPATDPDGLLDDMTITKGTAATHAIEFGLTSPLTMTIRGMTATGYNAADTNTDSTFHVKRTSGTVTINVVGGVGNFTYKSDGATVVIVIDPITVTVNVQDEDGNDVQNARVFIETAATIASGEMFEAAVTSITQAAGVATCTTAAAHGLVTSDIVVIRGAQPDGYNKVAAVIFVSATVFTYPVDSGLSSPATGTKVASFVAIHELTTAGGVANGSRTWGANQLLKGWARKKNTSTPFYKDANIAFTIDNVNGNTVNVVLLDDE